MQSPPDAATGPDGTLRDLGTWKAGHPKTYCKYCDSTILNDHSFKLYSLPTKHRELLGQNTSMGLKLELFNDSGDDEPACSIAISGDTGVEPGSAVSTGFLTGGVSAETLAAYYAGAELLVLHVGTIERVDTRGKPIRETQHLGLIGTVEILNALAKHADEHRHPLPKLVVLTEWGYEFMLAHRPARCDFAAWVVDELDRADVAGSGRYFAAVRNRESAPDKVPIIPADVNLRVKLPEIAVWCKNEEAFVPPNRIEAVEARDKQEILYV